MRRERENRTKAAEALEAWIAAQPSPGDARRALAAACNCDTQTIYRWCWGDQKPSDERRLDLQHATGNAVRVEDWCIGAKRAAA